MPLIIAFAVGFLLYVVFQCIKNVSIDFILGKTDIRTPIETIAAHHEGEEWTEEELEEIERFKEFVRMKRQQKKNQ